MGFYMVKQILSVTAVALVVASTSVVAAQGGGVIIFNGGVTDTTCTINAGNNTPHTVTLPFISVGDIGTDVGLLKTHKAELSIGLSNCSVAADDKDKKKTVKIGFHGADVISADGNYVVNTISGEGPRDIGFALVERNSNTPINLNKKLVTKAKDGSPDRVTLDVRYYRSSSAPVTVGAVRSNLTYTLSYD